MSKPCWPSKLDILGVYLTDAWPLGWGPDVRLEFFTPGENLCNCDYSPICGFTGWVVVSDYTLSLSLSHCGSFFISLFVEDILCYILISLISIFFENSCNFDVPMRWGGVSVLLHCIGRELQSIIVFVVSCAYFSLRHQILTLLYFHMALCLKLNHMYIYCLSTCAWENWNLDCWLNYPIEFLKLKCSKTI